MRKMRHILVLISASVFLCALLAYAQDSPSLGDAARQARLQKQQKDAEANKEDQAKDIPAKGASAKDAAAKNAQIKDSQGKDTPAKDVQPPKGPKKVITNDEIPEHIGPTRTSGFGSQNPVTTYEQPNYGNGKAPAEYWTAQIQAQKNNVASMESQIKSLTDSIQYAGGNCVANCVQWNERQKQKQDQAEGMKAQLEQMQKQLEDMQEMARKQGYGSSVYDP